MDAREERGMQIAATCKIEKNKLGWKVPSQSGNGSYVVSLDGGEPFCTCPDFETRHQPCKHIHAVEFTMKRETKADGSVTLTKSVKMTCTQEWPAYNEAQTHEQERFVILLRACVTAFNNLNTDSGVLVFHWLTLYLVLCSSHTLLCLAGDSLLL